MFGENYPQKYWWLVLVIVPIVVAMIQILPMFRHSQKDQNEPLRNTPVPHAWILSGRVMGTQSRAPLPKAQVRLEVQGMEQMTDTDTEGIYHFTLNTEKKKVVGRMTVEMAFYQPYERSLELSPEIRSLGDIFLSPQQAEALVLNTPTPHPTATPTPTVLPTATPIPTITLTPTMTPSPTPIPIPSHDLAILIVNQDNTIDWRTTQKFADLLQTKRMTVHTPFAQAFVTNRTFRDIFEGQPQAIENSGLLQYCRYALFGQKRTTFSTNTTLENTITASMMLTVHVISAKTGVIEETLSFAQHGAGFSQDAAEQAAIDRSFLEKETMDFQERMKRLL